MVSIRDIAKKAGVSISTVSKALNGTGNVSEITRERIRKMATQLDYYPNAFARGLASSGNDNIGFVIDRAPDHLFSNPFYSLILEGIEGELVKRGYNLLISAHVCTCPDAPLPRFVNSGIVGGLIIAGNVDPAFLQRLRKTRIPAVLVDNHLDDGRFDTVNTDNLNGALDMMRYLVSLGHKHIGFLLGNNRHTSVHSRYQAYRSMMQHHKLPNRPGWIAKGDVTSEGGYLAMQQLCRSGPPPTAVFASNDAMALGAMKFLRENGVRIPQQISIAGFDNIFPAEHVTPSLTTVHVDKIKMGALTAQRLIARLQNSTLAIEENVVPSKLIVRESTSAPGLTAA